VKEELQIVQSIAAGHIATIMTSHTIGYGHDITITISQVCTGTETIIPYEMISH
jgi:hypothetical protein